MAVSCEERMEPAAHAEVSTIEPAAKLGEPTMEPAAHTEVPTMEPAAKLGEPTMEPAAKLGEPTMEPAAHTEVPTMEPAAKLGEPTMEPAAHTEVPTMEPAAKPEEPLIEPEEPTIEPAPKPEPALGVPRSLPPPPLRGSWDRTGVNYEEARKRLMQAPAALATKEWEKMAPSKSKPRAAPTSAALEQTVIAGGAAPLGAHDNRRKPKVSTQVRAPPAETVSAPLRAIPDAPRPSAPSRALPDELTSSALWSEPCEPVPRPVLVAAPNRATLDHDFVTTSLAPPSSPPLVICNDTASGIPPRAAKPLAKAKARKAKALRRAANPPRAPTDKKSGANSRHLTAPPTPKSKLWALLVVLGLCCVVGLFTIFALVY